MPDARPLPPIRLAIVDDHPVVATAIAAAAAAEATARGRPAADDRPVATPGDPERAIEVVAVARTLEDALGLVTRPHGVAPDVVLCDIQLAGEAEGLAVLDAATAKGRQVIVLTSFDRASFMREAFDRGASGFLSKAAEPHEILDAVRRVAAGGTAFPSRALDAVRTSGRVPSAREREVLRFLREGFSNDEIGVRLGISTRTVESHLRRLFDRYAVLSRTELVVLALGEGWIAVPGR